MIPVFLHIPKNAGTYVQDVLLHYFIRITNEPKDIEKSFTVKKISITTDNCNLTVTVNFLTDYWKTDSNMYAHPVSAARGVNNPRARACDIETLKTYIQNNQLEVLSIVVEPMGLRDIRHGIFLAKDLTILAGGVAVNFTILRDCFSRQQSLYNYITSDMSSHEPSHGHIKEETFCDYLRSTSMEDSWLVRVLTNMPLNCIIDKNWYTLALDFLSSHNFSIADISETDTLLNKIVIKCYNKKITAADKEKPHYNKSQIKNKITIDDLDQDTRELFESRCIWDIEMWKHYCG